MAKKILVVDDEPEVVEILESRVKSGGYEVITASDGAEGLRKAYEEKPDLILLDILMPKIDGFDMCASLKENPNSANIPIIIITAAGLEHIEEKCLAVNADGCIRKPYDAADLLAKIKALLR